MKRRRRLNTQTIQRKKTTQTQRRPAHRQPGPFWAFVKFLIIIGIIALIGYTGYKYLKPVVQQKLPSLHLSKTPESEVTSAPQSPNPLPVENTTGKTAPQSTPVARQEEPQNTFVKATQVEILNGCGQQGVAKILADKLKALKYDVVNTGNYLKRGKPYFKVSKTKMIDQLNTKKSRKKCLELAKAIGLSPKQVQSYSNPNPIADITIVIGQDYKKLPIFQRK